MSDNEIHQGLVTIVNDWTKGLLHGRLYGRFVELQQAGIIFYRLLIGA